MAKRTDPFNRPIPGASLTDELGGRPWETPPTFTDPDEVLNNVLEKLEDPQKMDMLMDLIYAGTPVETIVNTWGGEMFARGDTTPDVIEMVKPSLTLVLMDQALNRKIPTTMFNDDIEKERSHRDTRLLNTMKDGRPEEYAALKESLQPPAAPVVEEDDDTIEGLIPRREKV